MKKREPWKGFGSFLTVGREPPRASLPKKRCEYRAKAQNPYAGIQADDEGLVRCLLNEGHGGQHLMP